MENAVTGQWWMEWRQRFAGQGRRVKVALLALALVVAVLLGAALILSPLSIWKTTAVLVVALAAAWLAGRSLLSRQPVEWLFLAFVALLPFTRAALLNIEFGLQPNYLAIVGVLGLLLLRALVLRLPLRIPRSPVTILLLVFVAIVGFSCLMSGQTPLREFRGEVRWIRSLKQFAVLIFMVLTYVMVMLVVQSRVLLRRSLQVFLVISVLVALYGLYQFVAYPLGLPFVDVFGTNVSFRQTRLYAIALAGGRFLRVWSTLSEPVWFGDYLVAVIPLLTAYVLAKQRPLPLPRRWHLALLVPLLLALLLTFARSAWFALLAALAVLALTFFRPREILRWAVILAVIGLLLIPVDMMIARLPIASGASLLQAVASRFLSPFQQEDFGNIHRYTGIVASLDIFRAHPWLGVGYGNFGFYFDLHKPFWGQAISDVLNVFPVMSGGMFFRLLSETGIVGTAAFALLLLAVAWEGWRAWRALRGDPFLSATAAGLLASYVGLVVRLTMADSIHFTYTWFIVALIVVLARRAERMRGEAPHPEVA